MNIKITPAEVRPGYWLHLDDDTYTLILDVDTANAWSVRRQAYKKAYVIFHETGKKWFWDDEYVTVRHPLCKLKEEV